MSRNKNVHCEWSCLPASNLQQLKREVLVFPPEDTLPANLSDFWLSMIARDLEKSVMGEGGVDGESCCYAAAPLALIFHYLLGNKPPGQSVQIPLETLYGYYCDLQAAFCLEMVYRATGLKTERVTLENIFKDRSGCFYRSSGSKWTH